MIRLNAEWTELMDKYRDDHSDPRNQLCHSIGIPMIMASIPLGLTIVGLPMAVPLFTVGWGFQFAGHYFEKKPPSFVNDKRSLLVGPLWWLRKMGVPIDETRPVADPPAKQADHEVVTAP